MSTEAHKTLFSGAAAYYARYRSPYPPELFDLVAQTFGLDGRGRLLDLGCGPGNVCLGLYRHFEGVVALDINPEMLAEGRRQAERLGAGNITWLERPAEEVGADLGMFRLVTMGRSFHWMRRDEVLQRAWERLEPGGGLALLESAERAHGWWELVVRGLAQRWRERERPVGWSREERHEAVVGRSGFTSVQTGAITRAERLDVDGILGELYSMSGTKPELFGANLAAFERDVRAVLGLLEPAGVFARERPFSYILARKPG